MNVRYAILILPLSSIGWGLTWIPIKNITDMGLASLGLIFIAFLSGALVLSPWLVREFVQWRPHIKLMLGVALSGGIANASFQVAMAHGDVIRVMILFYLLPAWSVIGGWLFLKEKPDALRVTTVLFCLAGAAVILDIRQFDFSTTGWIDLLGVSAGLGLAATNIQFRVSQTVPVMSKVSFMFMGCTFLTGIALLTEPVLVLSGHEAAAGLAVLYGALWLTLITVGTQWAVTHLEAGRAAVIIVLELVVAVVSFAVITGAELSTRELIGGIMVLSAALVEAWREGHEPETVYT